MTRRRSEMQPNEAGYDDVLASLVRLVGEARGAAARSLNSVMTTAYWEIGRHIVEHEQRGAQRAGYGEALLDRLSADLTKRFGRGFSTDRLETARLFYLAYPSRLISATLSRELEAEISATASRKSDNVAISQQVSIPLEAPRFALSWSHYVLLIRRAPSAQAREFYEAEALRGGWTVRQLERQIATQFYERTALSKNKAAMLRKGGIAKPEDAVTPEEEIKDPFVLEFLGLKDEYSESELEDAFPGENPPVGLILCTSKEDAVARYALEGLPSKVLAAEYRTTLPDERLIADAVSRTRHQLEARTSVKAPRRRK